MICLLFVTDVNCKFSVGSNKVEINALYEARGRGRDVFVLELDLSLAAIVIPGTDVAVEDLTGQHHVFEGGNVEGEGFVPNGVDVALLFGGLLISEVLVKDLKQIQLTMEKR